MQLVNIKKIGNDYGGDNLLFTIHIGEESRKRFIKAFKGLNNDTNYDYNVNDDVYDIIEDINCNDKTDFKWEYEESWDNMDYNGYFLKTMYIDKDDQSHKMVNDEVIITDDFIIRLIMDDCEIVLSEILKAYQEKLWSKINYENDIYEQFLNSECLSLVELEDLEDLANQKISIQEFADKYGYEWEG